MYIALTLALVVCLVALAIELRTKTIPNGLTVGALLLGPALVTVLHGVVEARQPSAWTIGDAYFQALGGAVFAVWIPYHLWRRNWLGGGAVKLTAAVAAIPCAMAIGFWMAVVWAAFGAFVWWARSRKTPGASKTVPGAAITLVAFALAALVELARP